MGPTSRIITTLGLLMLAAPAQAQLAPRVEVSAGARWIGSVAFDEVDATESAVGGVRRTLFKTTTDLDRSTGGEVRVSVRLVPALHVEGSLAFNPTHLTTRVTGDVESAADTSATEPVTQYLAEGGVLLHLARWHIGRLTPFAAAGAGYLRQLHAAHTLLETGRSYYAGGGVKYVLVSRAGTVRTAGIRGDVRATFLSGGVGLDEGAHAAPSVSASVFVGF